ncbi:MAG: phospholipase [Dysgonamonadaceae bacterium]|jgi:hypothetical protein|nr:phospholipase [Dysgonamonadaceae bacterium]
MKLKNLFASDTENIHDPFSQEDSEGCCGKHKICQKNRILKKTQDIVEYYDDDELDIFKNRSSNSYNDEEIALFTEIFHTLWKTDIPGWIHSLQLRGIELPNCMKESLKIIHHS